MLDNVTKRPVLVGCQHVSFVGHDPSTHDGVVWNEPLPWLGFEQA
jgi:hypothetical protein